MSSGCDWSPFAEVDASRPGVVVAVLSGGRVSEWRSFGSVSPGGNALDLDTPLYVASLAKQFTAACVALLAIDGQLGINDPVGRWVAELGPEFGGVRIEHLLSHTSGLPSSNDLDGAARFAVDQPMTTAERLQVLRNVELEHEPGTVHQYSNHGYVLLSEIVARVAGVPLGAFAAERIFTPLGMTNTGFLDVTRPAIVPGWAAGIRRVDIRSTCTGDGGLVSTVIDFARWDAWLSTAAVAALMLQRPVTLDGTCAHDAWGISIRSHHGERIESHGGAIDGYLAKYVRFPRLGTAFIALANTDEWGVADFDDRIRRLANATLAGHLDLDEPPWTKTVGLSPYEQ